MKAECFAVNRKPVKHGARRRQRILGRAKIKELEKQDNGWHWESMRLGASGGITHGRFMGEILTSTVHLCNFCLGRGEKPRGSRCSVCSGRGKVSIVPPAVICAFCRGRGAERRGSNLVCLVCKGKGFIHVQEPVERCRHCLGRGEEPTNKLPCLVCGGKGVITVRARLKRKTYPVSSPEHLNSGFFSRYKSPLIHQSHPQDRIKPDKKLYEETGWIPYRLPREIKARKEKITLNMATIHGIAKRLIAREWARALGKKRR